MLRMGQHGPPTLKQTRWEQFALLRNCSQPVISQLKDRMQTQTFKAGDLIMTKGTIGTSMSMIDVGEARAVVCGEVAQTLHSGDCFGELAFMATCRKIMKQQNGNMKSTLRSCDVEAAVDTVVITISVQDFLSVFYNNLEGSQAAITAMLQLEDLASKNRENIRRIEEGVLRRRISSEAGEGWRAVPVGESAKESWERIRALRVALEERKKTSNKDRVLREISVLAGIYCHFKIWEGAENFEGGGAQDEERSALPAAREGEGWGEMGAGPGQAGGCREQQVSTELISKPAQRGPLMRRCAEG